MPHPRVHHITVDCEDALALATFWAEVLGWAVGPNASEEFASVDSPARPADAPGWLFFKVPEGKTAKNRMHVDLTTPDLAADVQRLVDLGAHVVHEKDQWQTHWFTLTDPEGNEFCLVQETPTEPEPAG